MLQTRTARAVDAVLSRSTAGALRTIAQAQCEGVSLCAVQHVQHKLSDCAPCSDLNNRHENNRATTSNTVGIVELKNADVL